MGGTRVEAMIRPGNSLAVRLRRSRVHLALIPALTVLFVGMAGITQGRFHTDSHVYLAVVMRMVESGDWVHLRQANLPYHNKPPLGFWVAAPFVWAFGPEVWAVRVPMVLVGAACASAVYLVFKEVVRARVALAGSLVFALTHEVFRFTHVFSLDLVMLLFMLLSAWCVVRAAGVRGVRPARSRSLRLMALGGVPMGLALLAKPFVPLLLAAVLGGWLCTVGRARLAWGLAPLVAVAVLVAAPWHIEMTRAFPPGSVSPFWETYLFSQAIDRVGGGGDVAHVTEPVWYYGAELVRSYLPWLVPLAGGLAFSAIRRRPVTGRWAGDRLAWWWGAVWIGVMTLSAGKSMRYMVPVYPALALIAGAALVRLAPRWRRTPLMIPWLVLMVSAIVMASGVRLHDKAMPDRAGLYEFLDGYGGKSTAEWPVLWAAPDLLWGGAHVCVERGVYPKVAVSPKTPAGGVPAVGDLMLYRARESSAAGDAAMAPGDGVYAPRPGDTVLGRFGEGEGWVLVRIESAWGWSPSSGADRVPEG